MMTKINISTKRFLLAAVCLATVASAGLADQVIMKNGVPFPGTIIGLKDFDIEIRIRGRKVTKNITKVAKLVFSRDSVLTEAEELASKKDIKKALKAYDKAAKATSKDWMKQLIAYRRYQAIVASGRTSTAVKAWLKMMDRDGLSMIIFKPDVFGPKKSKTNRYAIRYLDRKAKKLSKDKAKNRKYLEAVLQLKLKIQEANGDSDGAAKTALEISNLDSADAPAEEAPEATESTDDEADEPADETETVEESADEEPAEEKPAAPARKGTRDLQVLGRLLQAGKPGDVIRGVQDNIKTYSDSQLPQAMVLLGRAQFAKYNADGKKDRKLLIEAGLNLVWVFAEYRDTRSGPEALYYAAQVNMALGQDVGAQNALRELTSVYSETKGAGIWVKKAMQDLEKLKAQGK